MRNLPTLFIKRPLRVLHTILYCSLVLLAAGPATSAQQKDKKNIAAAAPPALTRTTTRHEVRRFAYGSSLTILGAPSGSITIEAWPRSEVDITAEIELHAGTEDELTGLAAVNGFTLDEDVNHLRIITTGTHDKAYMRRFGKNFPKALLGLPWKIDYHIRVPVACDLEIDMGRGSFRLTGIEGSISLRAQESDATMTLSSGAVTATIASGSARINLTTRSWRGAGALIQLAAGDLTVELPPGLNADINADILRSGQIENDYPSLIPQERTTFTTRSMQGRAGVGGATLSFKVGDGTLRIRQQKPSGDK